MSKNVQVTPWPPFKRAGTVISPRNASDTVVMTGTITAGEPTDSAHLATKNYVDNAVGINVDYFFNNTASDIGGIYYDMTDNDLGGTESTLTKSSLTSGNSQALYNFASLTGGTGVTTLKAGIYDVHFHAAKTAGTRSVTIYAEIYTRTSGGAETLRMTTETSGAVTTKASFDVHAVLSSDVTIDATDRIVIKFYANVGSTGSDVDIALYQEGTTDSHFTLPSTTDVLSNIFVRKDGTSDMTGGLDIDLASGYTGFAIEAGYNINPSVTPGAFSTALGSGCKSTGAKSFSVGSNCQATGESSVAMGDSCIASAATAYAIGDSCTASQPYAFASGQGNTASGYSAFAIGNGCTASADDSYCLGFSCSASAGRAFAMGYTTTASGVNAFAINESTTAQAYDSFVIGRWNVVAGTTNSWVSTDPIFVIGIGADTSNRANALTILKDGRIGIFDPTPVTIIDMDVLVGETRGLVEMGYNINNAVTPGAFSVAMGYAAKATGSAAFSMGETTTATNTGSFALCRNTTASGAGSLATGNGSTASGDTSTATGNNTTASGAYSLSLGNATTASGESAIATGYTTTAQSYASLVLGRYNVLAGNTTSWTETDPIFVVGNGTGTGARANSVIILKNGEATMTKMSLTANSNQIVLDSDDGSGYTTTITDSATAARTITLPDITGTVMLNVVEDTTPQLGGDLDAQDKYITGMGRASFTQELDNGSKTTHFSIFFITDQKQKVTLTANTMTLTLDTTSMGVGNYQLKIVNGGLATLTWASESGAIKWAGGAAPTLTSSGTDIISFYWDGTNWYGVASLNFA